MATPQVGIFAVGTAAHCYLEFDARPNVDARDVVRALAGAEEPHTTVGGTNLVVGFRPELWAEVLPHEAPEGVRGFRRPIRGVDGLVMPATQHDAWLWVAGAAQDLVFDVAAALITALDAVATVAVDVTGWSYRHSRDLTGFEDGTENPALAEAPFVATIPDGEPGAGASIVLVQQWRHDGAAWNALPVAEQERVMGRTKSDSIEFDDDIKPVNSHVARTVIEDADGEELDIFRRNTPYGTVSDHGTMFIGFATDQARLQRMLVRMAGAEDGIRDELTRYTKPLTGAYYVVPSVEALAAVAS